MRIVFDLDDTISIHTNRDFANASPIQETIKKIRALKKDGCEITIYSARGQSSCKGDLALIEERNRRQVETWLKKYDVPYDQLLFGKPLGDLYVDDKGVSLEDFLVGKYGKLKGNSGSEIYRAGNRVIKKCKDAAKQAEWYAQAKVLGIKTPAVYSVVLDTISMEYINGETGAERTLHTGDIYGIASLAMLMSLKKDGYTFDTDALKRRAEEHLQSCGRGGLFQKLFSFLEANKDKYGAEASFCHGDLSLSNIIYAGGDIYLIDPITNDRYSSYLLDLAKLRFSLNGGEDFLHPERAQHDKRTDYPTLLSEYSQMLDENGFEEKVIALEAIYWIRLLKYTAEAERRDVAIRKAQELEESL